MHQGSPPYKIIKVTAPVARPKRSSDARIEQLLDIALRFHKQANLPEAELIYREILRHDFDNADAWHLLGVITLQSGYPKVAQELIEEAVALDPHDAAYRNSLGNTQQALGNRAAALRCYQRALAIRPDYLDAHYNQATVLRDEGRLEEAVDAYRTALRLGPDSVEVLNDCAGTLRRQGRLDEALEYYHRAVHLKPNDAQLYFNLGRALEEAGAINEAITAYAQAVQLDPNFMEAHTSLDIATARTGSR